jgi:multidrug efflux pump subunit AcrA (membrane-fusion protein)
MARQIFRQEALERLSSPDQLDRLMPLSSLRGWLALGAAGLVVAATIAWSFLGTLRTTAEGRGVLLRVGGLSSVTACCPGTVERVSVAVGDAVREGQELLRLAPTDAKHQSKAITVASPIAGRVLQLEVRPQTAVKESDVLATVEDTRRPLEAVLYLPATQAYDVRPGMEVQLRPAGHREPETRFPLGRVRSAGRFPASRAAMVRTLATEEAASALAGGEPQIEVVVQLESATTETLYSGTPCQAMITLARYRPITLILPVFGQPGGA